MNRLTKAKSLKIINLFNENIVPKFIYFDKITYLNNKKKCLNKIVMLSAR